MRKRYGRRRSTRVRVARRGYGRRSRRRTFGRRRRSTGLRSGRIGFRL